MELDPRIKDRRYIFDCFNADEVKKHIGKKCYMTCYIERFEDVESTAKCTLGKIDADGFFFDGESDLRFTFCLPFEFVAAEEKRLRPYTPEEFCAKFSLILGQKIHFRKKYDEESEQSLILQGLWYGRRDGKTVTYARLGSHLYALDELFNDFEWRSLYEKDFRPFGVEVEE